MYQKLFNDIRNVFASLIHTRILSFPPYRHFADIPEDPVVQQLHEAQQHQDDPEMKHKQIYNLATTADKNKPLNFVRWKTAEVYADPQFFGNLASKSNGEVALLCSDSGVKFRNKSSLDSTLTVSTPICPVKTLIDHK